MSTSIEKQLSEIKKQLDALTQALGGKTKIKVKDESAPKKEPNVWIKFTQRVGVLLKATLTEQKAPATVGKQFCSFLKEKKAYDLWADEEIVAEFASWERPEVSKMERDKSAKASEASSDAEASDGSKVKHQSEATKAAAAVKRAANKAKKIAEAAKTVLPASSEASEGSEDDAVSVPVAAPPIKAFKPKMVKASPKEYTMEQLADFDSFSYNGELFGRNARGDVVNADGEYVGAWTGKTILPSTGCPADWDEVRSHI